MQVNYRSYPHPVLSYFSDDYVRALYQVTINTSVSRTGYVFGVNSKTSSKSLRNLLISGHAVHAVHFECAATRFRKLFTSTEDSWNIEIPSGLLEGRVFICAFIVASKDIEMYQSDEFHDDFGGRAFAIKKGDVLALDRDRSFIAEDEHDPLRKLPSIFTIVVNNLPDPPSFDIESSGDKVVILVSKALHEIYKKISLDMAMAQVLCSMIIVPALVSLLETINSAALQSDQSDLQERRWYAVLKNKLAEIGYTIDADFSGFADSTLLISQKLIGQPLLGGMQNLLNVTQDAEDEE